MFAKLTSTKSYQCKWAYFTEKYMYLFNVHICYKFKKYNINYIIKLNEFIILFIIIIYIYIYDVCIPLSLVSYFTSLWKFGN